MKVFLSWSGERSKLVAKELRRWLPDVLNFIEPWISSEDVEKGARWSTDLAKQLESTHIGIICLTRENIGAPWILYEAGALSKALESSRVCTFLLGLRASDLSGPLVQFQASEATESDTLSLLTTLNRLLGENARSEDQLRRSFEKWWPDLKRGLASIPREDAAYRPLRNEREILEEVLDLVRLETRQGMSYTGKENFSALRLLEGKDLRRFVAETVLGNETVDENAAVWHASSRLSIEESPLDGLWYSRWKGGVAASWRNGTALLCERGLFLIAVHTDDVSRTRPSLIVAQRGPGDVFSGRYINLRVPEDSTPWIGNVVNNSRIDGYWKLGRWDFRR